MEGEGGRKDEWDRGREGGTEMLEREGESKRVVDKNGRALERGIMRAGGR